MGKYAASTFMSHIRIPFNYSGLLNLQHKLNDRLDGFFDTISKWNFKSSDYEQSTLNSTFQLYRGNTEEIFKLFNDLLVSLPHFPAQQQRQWDVVSFLEVTSALTLATYNMVQISKLEATIEAQQKKTDPLTDITKLHEQHLHKLDEMVDDIGN
jgi:hypothetical protein